MQKIGKLPNRIAAGLFFAVAGLSAPLAAQTAGQPNAGDTSLAYADLVDLADASQLVVRAKVTRQVEVEPERAPGLAPGFARLYVEADTLALISGNVPIGESLKYLVDVARDSKGRPPKLKKQEFILFARTVASRPGELQLVDPTAQFAWSAPLEA